MNVVSFEHAEGWNATLNASLACLLEEARRGGNGHDCTPSVVLLARVVVEAAPNASRTDCGYASDAKLLMVFCALVVFLNLSLLWIDRVLHAIFTN